MSSLIRSERPPVPSPYSTTADVQAFLTQFFLVLDWELSEEDAKQRARQLKIDGLALYKISKARSEGLYGLHGEIIYDELDESKYGWGASFPLPHVKSRI